MGNFAAYLKEVIPERDSLKLVKKEAENYYKQHSLDECFTTVLELYQSDNFQIQEVGVFLVGYAACENTNALSFLKDTVSQHKSWKVQEILAMAFDNYCKIIGYETAIPVIKEWLKSDCANTRRAVSEGLRIWTSRPYFKEHPQIAIRLLSSLKDDESDSVRIFRVDRIDSQPELQKEKAVTKQKEYTISKYTQEVFRMYPSDDITDVILVCDGDMMKIIIDKFGNSINAETLDNGKFRTTVSVCLSPTFYRWIFYWNGKIKIESPEKVINEYVSILQNELRIYGMKV